MWLYEEWSNLTDREKKGNIFVIDDDEAILEALTFCLGDEGYEVKTVRKAENLISTVLQFGADLILLDLFLSGQDGKEIAKELKGEQRTSHIPIIMFSAHPSAHQEAKTLGVAGFLAKPFDTSELFAVIEKHMLPQKTA